MPRIGALAIVAVGVLGSLLACHTVLAQVDPSGDYACDGTDPNGEPYGLALRVAKVGESYSLLWHRDERPQLWGLGLLVDGILAAAFVGSPGSNIAGIVHYRVSPDRLDGVWAAQYGQRLTETCHRVPDGPSRDRH